MNAKATPAAQAGRKAWVKKTPVEVVLEQIGKQEEKVAGMREELAQEDNLVANAERVCTYEQQRIELTNQSMIVRLQGEYNALVAEERRIEEKLHTAPPSGDLRHLRRRAIYSWSVTTFLALAGFALSLMTLAPFRLG